MTHEFKTIINEYRIASEAGIQCVLATVVALEGSSYRRPGVRMLLLEDGKMVGAVSGGCVEKEVFRQAESVFNTGISKVMTYDGRYRLGCDGILYILLESMDMTEENLKTLNDILDSRKSFEIESYYQKEHTENKAFGSVLKMAGETFAFQKGFEPSSENEIFNQRMDASFQLILIGAEHDAVRLCSMAAMTGWQVTVVVHPKEEKTLEDFPGASELIADEGDTLDLSIDNETALVVMTHSYVKDLRYLISLQKSRPAYFGLLGPARRREKLFNELLEMNPDIESVFLEQIYGPAGLDIGAETPQEIALSVLSEIVAVVNDKNVNSLKEKEGRIHA